MVFKYNSEQSAIEARQRIATAEFYPKFPNSETLYYLGYQEINGSFYIDARNETEKSWYDIESEKADQIIGILPTEQQPIPIM